MKNQKFKIGEKVCRKGLYYDTCKEPLVVTGVQGQLITTESIYTKIIQVFFAEKLEKC